MTTPTDRPDKLDSSDPPGGKELPDAPGLWLRFESGETEWADVASRSDGPPCSECCKLKDRRKLTGLLDMDEPLFPRGGWLPASPPISDGEREELESLRLE